MRTTSPPGSTHSPLYDAPCERPHADTALSEVASQFGLEPTEHPRVRISTDAAGALSRALLESVGVEGGTPYAWDDPKFWPIEADASVRSQLLTVGNALNFRFWRMSTEGTIEPLGGRLEGEHFTGSMYMWRRLRLSYDAKMPVVDAEYLATMDAAIFYAVFADDDGVNPLAEAIGERIANLQDLGKKLLSDWGGQFGNLLHEVGSALPKFTRLSSQFRAFDDPLGKLTLVNALMHRGSGLVSFEDSLLPAIDYQILKQLLRQRVLTCDERLDAKLRAGVYLDENEALQLRSAALEALLLVGLTTGLSGDLIDNQIWGNRTTCADSQPKCATCKFSAFCAKDVDVKRPLQLTRHY
jgi:hypothetical protein